MINIITGRYDNTKIGSLDIEVTIDESHNYMNAITDYPVEEGFNISDHAFKRPEEVTISGIFSLTSIPNRDNNLTATIAGAGANRIQNAFEQLLAIAGYTLPKQKRETGVVERTIEVVPQQTLEPQIIDIVSTLRVYTDMICTSLTIPVNNRSGQSIRFTMKFKRIRTVESKIVSIDRTSDLDGRAPNINNQAPKTKDVGKQTKTEATQDGLLLRAFNTARDKLSRSR